MGLSGMNGGMFDSLKSKLGFSSNADNYDRDYDDFDDFDDEPEYEPEPEDPAKRYEPFNSVSTRPARIGGSSSLNRSVSRPRLVSIDEVRSRTPLPDSLNRDPLPPRQVTSASSVTRSGAYRGPRTMVDASLPDPSTSALGTAGESAGSRASRDRGESLDSSFASTAGAAAASAASRASSFSAGAASSLPVAAPAKMGANRSVVTVRPIVYGDAERVANGLKSGDAVVLMLSDTPEQLVKRILDFAFGAASALDASVDCIGNKVFAITRGPALTNNELKDLHNQGVI